MSTQAAGFEHRPACDADASAQAPRVGGDRDPPLGRGSRSVAAGRARVRAGSGGVVPGVPARERRPLPLLSRGARSRAGGGARPRAALGPRAVRARRTRGGHGNGVVIRCISLERGRSYRHTRDARGEQQAVKSCGGALTGKRAGASPGKAMLPPELSTDPSASQHGGRGMYRTPPDFGAWITQVSHAVDGDDRVGDHDSTCFSSSVSLTVLCGLRVARAARARSRGHRSRHDNPSRREPRERAYDARASGRRPSARRSSQTGSGP